MGYRTKKLEGYASISDRLARSQYCECQSLFAQFSKASKITKKIHENGIIHYDLTLENIFIDEEGNVKIIDFDGCSYGRYSGSQLSLLLKRFMIDFRKEEIPESIEADKINLILSFFLAVFQKELQTITNNEFAPLAEKLQSLRNLRHYANILKLPKKQLCEMPYLDEVLDPRDDYRLDFNRKPKMKINP